MSDRTSEQAKIAFADAFNQAVDHTSAFKHTMCPWCDFDAYFSDGLGAHKKTCPFRIMQEARAGAPSQTVIPDPIGVVMWDVTGELLEATERFPAFNSPHEGYAVIAEELDELWDDVKKNDVAHSRSEAIQVAAMAIRYVIDCTVKEEDR